MRVIFEDIEHSVTVLESDSLYVVREGDGVTAHVKGSLGVWLIPVDSAALSDVADLAEGLVDLRYYQSDELPAPKWVSPEEVGG